MQSLTLRRAPDIQNIDNLVHIAFDDDVHDLLKRRKWDPVDIAFIITVTKNMIVSFKH